MAKIFFLIFWGLILFKYSESLDICDIEDCRCHMKEGLIECRLKNPFDFKFPVNWIFKKLDFRYCSIEKLILEKLDNFKILEILDIRDQLNSLTLDCDSVPRKPKYKIMTDCNFYARTTPKQITFFKAFTSKISKEIQITTNSNRNSIPEEIVTVGITEINPSTLIFTSEPTTQIPSAIPDLKELKFTTLGESTLNSMGKKSENELSTENTVRTSKEEMAATFQTWKTSANYKILDSTTNALTESDLIIFHTGQNFSGVSTENIEIINKEINQVPNSVTEMSFVSLNTSTASVKNNTISSELKMGNKNTSTRILILTVIVVLIIIIFIGTGVVVKQIQIRRKRSRRQQYFMQNSIYRDINRSIIAMDNENENTDLPPPVFFMLQTIRNDPEPDTEEGTETDEDEADL